MNESDLVQNLNCKNNKRTEMFGQNNNLEFSIVLYRRKSENTMISPIRELNSRVENYFLKGKRYK